MGGIAVRVYTHDSPCFGGNLGAISGRILIVHTKFRREAGDAGVLTTTLTLLNREESDDPVDCGCLCPDLGLLGTSDATRAASAVGRHGH